MHYPDLPLPNEGHWTQVASGIYWVRMPLPFELDHINLYLLEDSSGWYIVDTGLGTNKTKGLWDQIIEQLDKPVIGIVVTHLHPDHIGLAGWLTEKYNVPLYMSQLEYFMARSLVAGRNGASSLPDKTYFERAGLPPEHIEMLTSGGKGFGSVVSPVPVAYQRLRQNACLTINGNTWKVMIGRGHSPEHVCLYCEQLNVLISGDHILPSITPNIGVYSTEPEGNTLKDYLETLPVFAELPSETLVLPAHKQPFIGIQQRVSELINHHHEQLHCLVEACDKPSCVKSLLPVLFKRELNVRTQMFAIAECMSHLNYLLGEEKLTRSVGEDNKYYYKSKV